MKSKIGILLNADGFSCIPLQSISCVKKTLKSLRYYLPSDCHVNLRLKPGNNCILDYCSLIIDSYANPRYCRFSISKPSVPLDKWIIDKDILLCLSPSSAIDSILSHNKKIFLIKNECCFFPSYIFIDDSSCPVISLSELPQLILNYTT